MERGREKRNDRCRAENIRLSLGGALATSKNTHACQAKQVTTIANPQKRQRAAACKPVFNSIGKNRWFRRTFKECNSKQTVSQKHIKTMD